MGHVKAGKLCGDFWAAPGCGSRGNSGGALHFFLAMTSGFRARLANLTQPGIGSRSQPCSSSDQSLVT